MAGGVIEGEVQGGNVSPATRTVRLLDSLWRALRRPWPAALVGVLLLLLLFAQRAIPQVPGQTADDPAAAVRWLNVESDRWGSLGGWMETLGLFDVGASPLYYALLALAALLALLHLAEALRSARAFTRLSDLASSAPSGLAVETGWPHRLYRRRVARPVTPAQETPSLESLLRTHGLDVAQVEAEDETRLLGMRRPWAWRLRTLLPLGVFLVLGGLWANSVWGWGLETPELAPGDAFTLDGRAIAIDYPAVTPGATVEHALTFRQGEREVGLEVGARTRPSLWTQARAKWTQAHAVEGSPALLLVAPEAVLARPEDTEPRSAVGLLFPQLGSEQLVVLPNVGAGVRIVRLAAEEGSRFLVELFAPDEVEPVERVEVTGVESLQLPVDEGTLELQVVPAHGVVVTAARRPADGLIALGLLLAAAGAAGWFLRSGFALVQIRPWPVERSEVTLQTTDPQIVAALDDAPAETPGEPPAESV